MVEVFLKPLESVVNLLIARHDRKEDREIKLDAERQAALGNLFAALTKTVAYNETLPAGRDRLKEVEVSTLWYAAMAACRPFFEDQDLYWMWHKSLFWLNNSQTEGRELSHADLEKLKIDLPTVRDKVSEMIWASQVTKHLPSSTRDS